MTAPTRQKDFIGVSSTGTKHTLVVTPRRPGGIKFAIAGPTGKQHAGVFLDNAMLLELAQFLGGVE